MPWAIHAAELRLWLQLIVETEFKKEELRQHPLLPNLNLNLRVGDSLVQEIGGISFNLRTNNLGERLKRRLCDLKQEKRRYFENSPMAKFKSLEEVRQEEVTLFEEIIDERVVSLRTNIQVCEDNIKKAKSQKTLGGDQIINEKKVWDNKVRIDSNNDEIRKLMSVKSHLNDPEKKPFVWDIDYAEIFANRGGFDIVIGNPPYVRQEMISPPNKVKSEVRPDEKLEYKNKLGASVRQIFPVIHEIDKKSDYYVYFYFHGLSLLSPTGTFCFITSNSWLDVGYGKNLQEFLCKYVPITAIYDSPKRSFAHADVNTIIALFGAPLSRQRTLGDWAIGMNGGNEVAWPRITGTAKFVMFKKPYSEVLNTKNLIDIENIKVSITNKEITKLISNIKSNDEFRVFPFNQADLLEDGWEYNNNLEGRRFSSGGYIGNKWGGKFLRAPDIFFTILKKGGLKLTRLDTLATLRFGTKTGVNDFFYLPNAMYDIKSGQNKFLLIPRKPNLPTDLAIEQEYLNPVVTSPRECLTILVEPISIKSKILICNQSMKELDGTSLLKYISWSSSQKTKSGDSWKNAPSVRGRKNWYTIKNPEKPPIFYPMINNTRLIFCRNSSLYTDANLVGIYPYDQSESNLEGLLCSLNGTYNMINLELLGISNLGEGAIKLNPTYIKNSFILKPSKKLRFPLKFVNRKILSIFEEVGINQYMPIREQEPAPLPDRAELDNIIFDELGLTQDERKEVYWSVCELVKQRIDKARSLKN
jgi:hypothetical protein